MPIIPSKSPPCRGRAAGIRIAWGRCGEGRKVAWTRPPLQQAVAASNAVRHAVAHSRPSRDQPGSWGARLLFPELQTLQRV